MWESSYLWLEEHQRIYDSAPRLVTQQSYSNPCFYHNDNWEAKIKTLINKLQGSLFSTDEDLYDKLENVLCSCEEKPRQAEIARAFGYSAGTNLPTSVKVQRQKMLHELFYNIFNTLSCIEDESILNEDEVCEIRGILEVKHVLVELLECCKQPEIHPNLIVLLYIIKQRIEKPLVWCMKIHIQEFVKLVQSPLWETCLFELQKVKCNNVYIDFDENELLDYYLPVYINGPSVTELKQVKRTLIKYIAQAAYPKAYQEKTVKECEKTKNNQVSKEIDDEISYSSRENKSCETMDSDSQMTKENAIESMACSTVDRTENCVEKNTESQSSKTNLLDNNNVDSMASNNTVIELKESNGEITESNRAVKVIENTESIHIVTNDAVNNGSSHERKSSCDSKLTDISSAFVNNIPEQIREFVRSKSMPAELKTASLHPSAQVSCVH